MAALQLCALLLTVTSCLAFGGGEEHFVRKYAMMKVYESCFGPEVVKEVRMEMRAACSKCAASHAASQEVRPPQDLTMDPMHDKMRPVTPSFDPAKLQQAILGFKQANPQLAQMSHHASQYLPYPTTGSAGYYQPQHMFYPAGNGLYGPQSFYNPAAIYPGQAGSMYQQPAYYPGYFSPSGQRVSRDLDIQGQLESLTLRMGGRVKNVTCVMQELGYLDENLKPNFQRILERINRLPVSEELKKDMTDGIEFCRQFSQCIPETKDKYPLSRDLMKPMFFFRCHKHKKLEACVLKDVRERYQHEDLNNEDGVGGTELRSMTSKVDPDEYEDMVTSLYDFLYGAGSINIDSFV